jgi:hypothetical protein
MQILTATGKNEFYLINYYFNQNFDIVNKEIINKKDHFITCL